jgi:predicted O-methyltransferase YrrM
MSCPAHDLAASRNFLVAADVDLIRELVQRLRKQDPRGRLQVIDIGAGSGTTALSVLAEESDRITITTIDNDARALQYTKAAISYYGHLRNWRGRQSDSARAIYNHGGQDIDLLLIDAGHTYKEVKADLEAWLPRLRTTGFVWVHDYGDPRALGVRKSPGVKRAINELLRRRELSVVKIAGLGWAGQRYVEQEERDADLGPRRKRTTR